MNDCPPAAPDPTTDLLRLYDVQETLVGNLETAWAQVYNLQAREAAAGAQIRLLTAQPRLWPIRLHWQGFGLVISRKGIQRSPWRPWAWYSRHGASYWYGMVRYVRLGPVTFEFGRDDALNVAGGECWKGYDPLLTSARQTARVTVQRQLQIAVGSAESRHRGE